MTDEALDALAKQLLLDAARLEYSDIIQSEDEHTFSPSFERKMKKLVRRADHPVRHRITQTAACVALVVIIGGGSVLAGCAEARAAFFGWVREVYETYFVYRYEGAETIAPEDVVYMPSWVPDGYEMTVAPEPGDSVFGIYKNDANGFITFAYVYNQESAGLGVMQAGDVQQVLVGEIPAELYVNENEADGDTLVWTDEDRGILCWITSTLPAEDLIKMAESVTAFDAAELARQNAVYVPAWLPEGYETIIAPEPGATTSVYENDSGSTILLIYGANPENAVVQIEKEGFEISQVFVNGIPADLYYDPSENANCILVWFDEEIGAIFQISAIPALPKEDIIKIAESIELAEPEQ